MKCQCGAEAISCEDDKGKFVAWHCSICDIDFIIINGRIIVIS